jgi:hypothetical protein
VFPEAAVADPLADLEVLDEWRSGVRVFPYPGQYGRLELAAQEGKGPSTSSVGVLGEIMAGLFAQVGISPWIIVRVVGHWPDFIFYSPREERYAFVEAKAFTTSLSLGAGLLGRVHESLLGECALDAVQQVNTDPWVTVWCAFTAIVNIKPFQLMVTFVEFDCPDRRKSPLYRRLVPDAVVAGIATQAVVLGAQELQVEDPQILRRERPRKVDRDELRTALTRAAHRNVRSLLAKSGSEVAIMNTKERIAEEIGRIASAVLSGRDKDDEQRPFYEGRRIVAQGGTAVIRMLGKDAIFMKDLSGGEIDKLEHRWQSDWRSAPTPYERQDSGLAWRFGGALYWLGAPPLARIPE